MSENLSLGRSDCLQTLFTQVRGWRGMVQRNRRLGLEDFLGVLGGRWERTELMGVGLISYTQTTHPGCPQVQDLTEAKPELLC